MTTQNFNPAQFFDATKFDASAFTALQQETTEAAKNLAQCNTNYARESMEDMATFWRNWMSSGPNLQDKMEIQTQAAREGFAKALAHNKEVTAIMQCTQEKVMKTLNEQTNETFKKSAKAKK